MSQVKHNGSVNYTYVGHRTVILCGTKYAEERKQKTLSAMTTAH